MNVLRRILVVACCATLAIPLSGVAAEKWNLYTYVSTSQIATGAAMQKIAKRISKETDGALKVRVHLGGSLPIKATNITQAVSQGGTVQIADDGFPYGNVPIAGILNLPMLLTNEQEYDKARKIMTPYIRKAFAKQGIELLGFYNYTLQVLWSTKKLTSFDDIKGARIRVTSPQQAAFIRAFGGTPVTLGTPEVAPALQRGVVDGAITSSTGGGSIWEDMLKSTYRLGPNFFTSYLIANKAAFDALTPGEQARVREVVQDVAASTTKTLREKEDTTTQRMADNGMVVTPARPEDVKEGRERLKSYWHKWAKDQGPKAEKALKQILAAIKS